MPNGGIEGGLEMRVLIDEGSYWWETLTKLLSPQYTITVPKYILEPQIQGATIVIKPPDAPLSGRRFRIKTGRANDGFNLPANPGPGPGPVFREMILSR